MPLVGLVQEGDIPLVVNSDHVVAVRSTGERSVTLSTDSGTDYALVGSLAQVTALLQGLEPPEEAAIADDPEIAAKTFTAVEEGAQYEELFPGQENLAP